MEGQMCAAFSYTNTAAELNQLSVKVNLNPRLCMFDSFRFFLISFKIHWILFFFLASFLPHALVPCKNRTAMYFCRRLQFADAATDLWRAVRAHSVSAHMNRNRTADKTHTHLRHLGFDFIWFVILFFIQCVCKQHANDIHWRGVRKLWSSPI